MDLLDRFLKKAKQLYDNQQQSTAADPYNLDNPLLHISPLDTWTMRHSCSGVLIVGETGSGKTTGSGAALAKAYLRAGMGGLVMVAKPEEKDLWVQYAIETGREKSLIIFGIGQPWRFNFLNYELHKGGGHTENIVNLFTHVMEIAEGKQDSGSHDEFWQLAAREMLRNAIDLLVLAKGTLTLEDIVRLIAEAPQSLDEVGPLVTVAAAEAAGFEPPPQAIAWWNSSSLCAECLDTASRKEKTAVQMHDFTTAFRYWTRTFPSMGEKMRSSIAVTFTSMADLLLHGFCWELLCTTTNLTPEVTYTHGAVIVMDLAIQEHHQAARVIQGIWKFMFQRSILQRNVKIYQRSVFLWADEAQNFVNSFDFKALAVARSARLCHVLLTQNVNGLYGVLGAGGRGESQANSLMANLTTKILHSNSDPATNHYAAEVIGQQWTTAMNFSASSAENSHNSQSNGGGEVVQYKVLPQEFSGLRKGGPANNLEVEAIIFQGGRVFNATGENYIKVVFKQG